MTEWLAKTFNELGYLGIALAMLLENVFPPIPSEAILPTAGMAARRGAMSVVGVILAATAGSLAGAIGWYYVGRWVGHDRLRGWADRKGRYLGFSPKDIDKADAWFHRWGGTAVFVGRMIPGIRTLVSVPAGLAGMPLGRFVAFSTAGSAIWSTLLVLVGWWLGRSAATFETALSWAGIAVSAFLVFWIGKRIWKARRHYGRKRERGPVGRAAPRSPFSPAG